jgi:hypothetical protein
MDGFGSAKPGQLPELPAAAGDSRMFLLCLDSGSHSLRLSGRYGDEGELACLCNRQQYTTRVGFHPNGITCSSRDLI